MQEVLATSRTGARSAFLNATLMFRARVPRVFVYRLCEVSHSDPMTTGGVRSASLRIAGGRAAARDRGADVGQGVEAGPESPGSLTFKGVTPLPPGKTR